MWPRPRSFQKVTLMRCLKTHGFRGKGCPLTAPPVGRRLFLPGGLEVQWSLHCPSCLMWVFPLSGFYIFISVSSLYTVSSFLRSLSSIPCTRKFTLSLSFSSLLSRFPTLVYLLLSFICVYIWYVTCHMYAFCLYKEFYESHRSEKNTVFVPHMIYFT